MPPHADRILVLRLGAVGDVLRTAPAFAAIRRAYPEARLSWLVERKAEGAVALLRGVDEVILFPREELEESLRGRNPARLLQTTMRFVAALRRRDFDLVVDFHAILKTGVLARLSGARLRVGYAPPFAREHSWLFANARVQISPERVTRFERNAALVEFLGIEPAPEEAPWLDPPAADRERMRSLLGAGPRPVLIHVGSSPGARYKRYPAASWALVARALSGAGGAAALPVLVACGPDAEERALAAAVVSASGGAARLAPRTESLAALSALCQQSALFLGADSGPLHLAALSGTPVVQLLGPTDPVENRPFDGVASRNVRVPLACSPCRRGCAPAPCMSTLPPQAVVSAARELLDAQRLEPGAPGAGAPPPARAAGT